MSSGLKYEDYTVAWICALPFEATAAMFMLDELHDGEFPWRSGQESIYTAGSLNGHNVVIACLPKGEYAIGAAARVVGQLRLCFPNLTFGLMVGIGAGVPGPEHDIRLGDVVVGSPEDSSGGCVGYDLGKETIDGFKLKGWLNATDPVLRSAIASIESRAGHHGDVFVQYLEVFRGGDYRGRKFLHPGTENDLLYHAVRTNELVKRPVRDLHAPVVHYGLSASGNKVVKHATLRDELRDRHNIICFEMEAAGLMNTLPVAVIRGISDYADSHKNDIWQPYAAATAAAYAKGLLKVICPGSVGQSSFSLQTIAPTKRVMDADWQVEAAFWAVLVATSFGNKSTYWTVLLCAFLSARLLFLGLMAWSSFPAPWKSLGKAIKATFRYLDG
jgi:nucleoside phosphorylase